MLFIITHFRGNLSHNKRNDKIKFPIVEDNFETKGIGFEDGPEC